MSKKLVFVLGGARSGKSQFVEGYAREHARKVLFVATAQAFDDEMQTRIAHHRETRPAAWHTLEVPLGVGGAIKHFSGEYELLILDCLTLLAANALMQLPEDSSQEDAAAAIMREIDLLLATYAHSSAVWLVVSNEVGMGVVPPTKLGRFFRDELGKANQKIAQAADEVILMVAGLPWRLKPYP